MNTHKRYCIVGLEQPKKAYNIASVLRAASCYNILAVYHTGRRYTKSSVDTTHEYLSIPLVRVNNLRDIIPYACVPVAVEMLDNAIPLPEYAHPEQAYYIFGPEDSSLGKRITSWCRDIIYIPTKSCMNLAATVNVVMYDRLAKKLRRLI